MRKFTVRGVLLRESRVEIFLKGGSGGLAEVRRPFLCQEGRSGLYLSQLGFPSIVPGPRARGGKQLIDCPPGFEVKFDHLGLEKDY